jgi:hypothetical protein
MFCPTCGKDNAKGLKYCASCGTNLMAVSQALSGDAASDFFTKTDSALDQLIARYSERVFKNAPTDALDRSISKSWRNLGQGVLTSLIDMMLFILMWNVFPIKFFLLLIRTPIHLLTKRAAQKGDTAELSEKRALDLTGQAEQRWLPPGSVISVTEHTTVKLAERGSRKQNAE